MPDPDLLIRTSGENRISNFLLWQLAYTEIHITDVLWPDFTRGHLDEVGLTLLLAGGLAVLMWLLSLRSPHAAVGAEPKVTKKREELPEGVNLPSPSIQPLILATGMTITVLGIVFRGFAISLGEGFSIPIILVLGMIITLAGFIGWIREDRKTAQPH